MTANPGQSGAPVLDKFGAVIGIITGKQSNTTGTTYAVQTKALMNLVKRSGVKIKMNDNNKLAKLDRTVQVAKIRDYVFAVKVN
jgi:serine protease Do